ncbi:putative disease resistance RPP13-like protein 1 isoform X2 [Coffea arabica]|uniref:Disease resistance RPP13-like protein 1 isoform X2 n=1 Tax=Coffea arabica TaxID=13443 RepID=A0A6P6UCI0_COFAR|nr:putative disease resistance RPP13-like protein 1 isoform X2 [Coffea arabica]
MASVIPTFLPVVYDSMPKAEFLNFFRDTVCQADVELFKKLKMNLVVAAALLDDADIKQTRNPSVKQWLEELRDTVYEADGLLNEINAEALRVKEENVCQSSSRNWESASDCIPSLSSKFLKKIIPQIERIAVRLEAFVKQINPLGLQVGESKRQSCQLPIPTTSLVDKTAIYGRDNDREKIIQMLLSEDANGDRIAVIPIFGLGGIGKTTLAQLVYNDQRAKDHFSTMAWVYVSEEYDPTRITKELLRELNISFSDSHENLNSLQVKLKVGLTGKKFLLVLDDVWISDYNQWGNLRIAFEGGLRGSRIILTTRNLYVARMMGREKSIHHMNLISEDDCWSLFVKHAFENRDGSQALEFEEIGKKIVKKCGGLPLAVKTVAGLLRSKTTSEEWEDIFMSEDWSVTNNQMIPPLSYNHLLSHPNRYQSRSTGMTQELQDVNRQLDITFWYFNNSLQINLLDCVSFWTQSNPGIQGRARYAGRIRGWAPWIHSRILKAARHDVLFIFRIFMYFLFLFSLELVAYK